MWFTVIHSHITKIKEKGEKEDSRVAKAARFFLACKQNMDPAVKVDILQAMRSWGYKSITAFQTKALFKTKDFVP